MFGLAAPATKVQTARLLPLAPTTPVHRPMCLSIDAPCTHCPILPLGAFTREPWSCPISLPRTPPSATVTMCPQHDAPSIDAATMNSSVQPRKEPRLDAGNKHHDHCVCPISEDLKSQEAGG
jgi:hypothetical protein